RLGQVLQQSVHLRAVEAQAERADGSQEVEDDELFRVAGQGLDGSNAARRNGQDLRNTAGGEGTGIVRFAHGLLLRNDGDGGQEGVAGEFGAGTGFERLTQVDGVEHVHQLVLRVLRRAEVDQQVNGETRQAQAAGDRVGRYGISFQGSSDRPW